MLEPCKTCAGSPAGLSAVVAAPGRARAGGSGALADAVAVRKPAVVGLAPGLHRRTRAKPSSQAAIAFCHSPWSSRMRPVASASRPGLRAPLRRLRQPHQQPASSG